MYRASRVVEIRRLNPSLSRITKYLNLVVLLAGFQKIRIEDLHQDSEIFGKAVHAAQSVIQITLEHLYPTSFLRYAMDSTFLYVAFAAAFLINVSFTSEFHEAQH